MKIMHVQELVEKALIAEPATRDNDRVLYRTIIKSIHPEVLEMPMGIVLELEPQLGIPSIESVGRARRKIQEHNPLLRASKRADDARYSRWKEYREYVQQE